MSRIATWMIMASLVLAGTVCTAGDPPIFKLEDPRGDDHGDGSLRYPMRDDLHVGDLDLISLTALPDPEGTLFEAVFARTITPADRQIIDQLGGELKDICRFGFYTFNLDIYIDTDRISGSGHTAMLPGRKADVDPANAWEKVVCLTPRPFEARDALRHIMESEARKDMKKRLGRIEDEEMAKIKSEINRDLTINVFFPTRITVTGPRIRFLVPAGVLGGSANPSWGYVVAITGADYKQRFGFEVRLGDTEPVEPRLMNLPIGSGLSKERFGGAREEDDLQPPLVDVTVPPGVKQETVLKDYDARISRPARVPAVVPSGEAPPAPQTAPALK